MCGLLVTVASWLSWKLCPPHGPPRLACWALCHDWPPDSLATTSGISTPPGLPDLVRSADLSLVLVQGAGKKGLCVPEPLVGKPPSATCACRSTCLARCCGGGAFLRR